MPPFRRCARPALSLVEIVVSSMLVSIVVVGSLSLLGASVRTRSIAAGLLDGPALAESLLAEIMASAYDDPEEPDQPLGINTGDVAARRDLFDDVDDFDGWSSEPPQTRDGTELTGHVGWTRAATVQWASPDTGNVVTASDTGLKRITITVTAPDGRVTTRHGMRSRAGALEQPDTTDKTVVTSIDTTISIGSRATTVRGSINLLNHVEAPN